MNNINTSFKKIYSLLILTFLFFLILINTTHSEEKIGSIVSLKNEVFAINAEGEKRLLDLYDEILLQDEIVTNELSSATVQYNDNSTIIIKKSSSFKVTDFNINGLKDIFLGEVQKGSVIIESGKIAKEDNGSMVIELPNMTLGIKGTRFNIENNPDGTSEVSLAKDSFGNVGTINIASEGEVKTLFDTEQVISVNSETGISERPKTDDEKQELVDVSNDLIEASSIDENVIQKNLEEKLLNGSLLDANGDGVIDESDIEVIKEGIKLEKQEKLDFIVDNSTGENTEFLSQVLNQSDETSIGQSMDKIFESNSDLLTSVITNLASVDNTFLTTSNSEANNAIKEKIYTQMLNNFDDDNNNIALIGNIISKSDGDTVERMVNFVEISDTNNEGANLALQVLSSVADATSLYSVEFGNEEQTQIDRLMQEAVFSAANSEDGAIYLANIMSKGSEDSVFMMMDTIGQVGETFADSTLALEVFSSMADDESFDDMDFGDEGQDLFDDMMEDAVYSAAYSDDGAMMLGNMMANGSEESMGMMMSTISMVGETDPNSTLALEVLSSMADDESFDDMDFGDEGQDLFDDMMEDAVYSAAYSDDGAMMLGNMMANGSEESMGMMMSTISMVGETDPNSTLALEVLSSMAENDYLDDMDFGDEGQDLFDDMMEDAVYAAAYSDDGAEMLGNMMANSNADAVGTMLDYISDVSENDPNSSFAAEVLSTVASAGTMNDTYFDAETMDQIYEFVETIAYTDTEISDDELMYDGNGFSMSPPYYHKDTGTIYDVTGFDRDGNEDIAGGDDDTYDAEGFSMSPPYYHEDTGTIYNSDGYDRNGNYSAEEGDAAEGDYDANGFSMSPPYYHKATTALYDNDGYDRNGNYIGFGEEEEEEGGNVAWSTTSASFPTTLTKNTGISSVTLEATGVGTITYTFTGTFPDGIELSGNTVSGTPSGAQGATSVTFTATDEDDNTSELAVSFPAVTGGGGNVAWSTTSASFPTTLTKNTGISSVTLEATGVGTITYTFTGTFPDGIELSGNTVSGTPSGAQGATSVTFTATDEDDNTSELAVSFPAVTGGGGNVAWSTAPGDFPTTLTVDDDISSVTLEATGVGTITYTFTGTFPDGIELSGNTVSGTPSGAQGATSVTFTATDEDDNTSELAVSFPAVTGGGGNVAWSTAPGDFPTTLTVDDDISSVTLEATGVGTITYTFTGTFPDGIELSGNTVSGTPSGAQGATSVTFTATDEDDNTSELAVSFPAVTGGGGNVAWSTTSASFPTTLTKNTGISSVTLEATGVGTITYTFTGTFPDGIELSGNTVSGNPNTEQAATSVTITATDEDNNTSDLFVSFPAVDPAAGGSFDANGFSTVTPFDHRETGTQFDSEGLHRTTRTERDNEGYNSAGYNVDGFNIAGQWNISYDMIDDVSGA